MLKGLIKYEKIVFSNLRNITLSWCILILLKYGSNVKFLMRISCTLIVLRPPSSYLFNSFPLSIFHYPPISISSVGLQISFNFHLFIYSLKGLDACIYLKV